MPLLRIAILIALVICGGGAALLGGVVLASALASGMIMISYVQDGNAVAETVLRASDPSRYWRLVGGIGAVPLLLGAAACWVGIARLRR